MAKVAIFWDPEGVQLDQKGSRNLIKVIDGDTPRIEMDIRMLSVDTPEVKKPGGDDPAKMDEPFAELADWLKQGKAQVDDELAAYLMPKLKTGKAGTLQDEQGAEASAALKQWMEERLKRTKGAPRKLFLRTANEPFDSYGRLLAYIAPAYSSDEVATLAVRERMTFNLQLIDSGWAAFFPIFPSLPKHSDLVLTQKMAQDAVDQKRGQWADPLSLLGYEYRMCVRLHEVTKKTLSGKKESGNWIERYCVDITTREIFAPQQYHLVKPYNRLFIWPKDVPEAVAKLNLMPAA